MSETAIRDLLARVVEAGPPSGIQLPVDDVLARNGRALRRRRIGQAGGAVMVLVGLAGLLALLPGRSPSAQLPAPAATRPAPASPAPTGPAADYRSLATAAMALLTTAVPDGYALPDRDTAPGADPGTSYALRQLTWWSPGRPTKVRTTEQLYEVFLEVQLDGRAAMLTVRTTAQNRPDLLSPADPCATRVSPDEQECRVQPASNGTPVRIGGWRPVSGPVREAVRMVGDVLVTVQQAGRPRPGVYGLGRPVLTDKQLADLAANPALLPASRPPPTMPPGESGRPIPPTHP
jgi:hypothetical protein